MSTDKQEGMTIESSLFPEEFIKRDASFSPDGLHRYSLCRVWDENKPLVMFIGLNPSTANADEDDATIESVTRISKFNGFGGFYMMNCWTFISTKPELLQINPISTAINDSCLLAIGAMCQEIVFAWGNFKIVSDKQRDKELFKMFPTAKCLTLNKNGSPGHPLYKKGTTRIIPFNQTK